MHAHSARLLVGLLCLVTICGCGKRNGSVVDESATASTVVTADIQAGIEKHIADVTEKAGGFFPMTHDGKELELKLVRVHTEYLATLGPRSHFACVDLVDENGDVYDLDFFIDGDAGAMTVTESSTHKLNGVPFYLWAQREDKTWHRVEVDEASQKLLGIIVGSDEFDFVYKAKLPEITAPARMWLPIGQSDDFQKVKLTSMTMPGEHRELTDSKYGNKILFVELGTSDSGKDVELIYHVQRKEKSVYESTEKTFEKHLGSDLLVPIAGDFKKIAEKATAGRQTDLRRARAIYDHVMEQMKYAKFGEGWGQGDATFACDACRGNCTDYHAYFMALTRSIGIPSRFAIGAGIPSSRDDGGMSGYHCWVEFHADGKWWPVDISEADKYSSLSIYYFGHHPANRFELSRGRDLVVEPGPESGPINFLAYPVLEVDGNPIKIKPQFTFTRTKA